MLMKKNKKSKKKLGIFLKKINYKKIKKDVSLYLRTNILTITFLIMGLMNGVILRFLTVKNYLNVKPILGDLIVLLVIAAFAYLIKPNRQFKYYLFWIIFLSVICFANSVYYFNYISFISLSLLKTSTQLGGYVSAVTTLLELKYLVYILPIIVLVLVNKKLKKGAFLQ